MIVTKKTLNALDSCIIKWESIAKGEGISMGTKNCDLCKLFNDRDDGVDDCKGCPINKTTGKQYCLGTSFIDYSNCATSVYASDGDCRFANIHVGDIAIESNAKVRASKFADELKDIRKNCKLRVR